jgi:hypothetical protein
LSRHGHGVGQQQPMIREPTNSNSGAADEATASLRPLDEAQEATTATRETTAIRESIEGFSRGGGSNRNRGAP